MADIDDQQLRNILKSDPQRALGELYKFYFKRLRFMAFRLTRSEALADDMAHQAFLKVYNKREELSKAHAQPLGKYMETIIENLVYDYNKRQSRQDDIDELLLTMDFPEDDTEPDASRTERIKAMRKEIATFTPREQEYAVLRIDEGLTPDEIAEVLGVSRKMVEKWNTSVIKKLRTWADKYKKRYM